MESQGKNQQFCNIFSTNYWVGYFSPSLLVQVFFLFRIALPEFFFKITPPPPPSPSKVKWSTSKLKHHPIKSKVMFIGSSRNLNKKVKDNCVLLNNAPIPRTDTFTCLGVDLDEKLS